MIAKMHGARSFASLGELSIAEGARVGATMAVLVEEARWRTSARGRRFMMATLSDATGQFAATCFEDSAAADLEEAARNGGCGLATVELDRRPGEESPRVTVKAIKPFEQLASVTRFALEVRVVAVEAVAALAALIGERRGGRCRVTLVSPLADGGEARLREARPPVRAPATVEIARQRGIGEALVGGIGGLAAANALQQAGHVVTVYEQSRQYLRVGADINLTPNAVRALDGLGARIAQAVRASAAVRPTVSTPSSQASSIWWA